MSRNKHLLEPFMASEETNELGAAFLRKAQIKTSQGSGYDIGGLTGGLPAVCMLLASERLNNGDVKQKGAQVASCLRPQDFRRLYDLVKSAIEASENSISYDYLHQKFKTASLESILNPFLVETEREFRRINASSHVDELIIKCVVYFWVCISAKVRTIPGTEIYASGEGVPVKKFSAFVQMLNDSPVLSRAKIRDSVRPSPAKRATTAAASSSKQPQEQEPQTPLRRSSRTTAPQTSPTKSITRATPISPTKIAQPTIVGNPWKPRPMREMPSRDTPKKDIPKKRPADSDDPFNNVEPDHEVFPSPIKKRKEDLEPVTPTRQTLRSSTATQSRPSPQVSPTKSKATPLPKISSPLKPVEIAPEALISDSSDEEENDFHQSRRFRPVYLDFKEWNARDPRLDKIWRKVNKTMSEISSRNKPTRKAGPKVR